MRVRKFRIGNAEKIVVDQVVRQIVLAALGEYRIAPGYIDVVIIVSALYDIPAVRLAGVCRSRHINDRDVQAVHQILERSGIACADRLSVHKSAVECLILRRIFHIINLPDTFFKDSLDLPIVIHRTVDIT